MTPASYTPSPYPKALRHLDGRLCVVADWPGHVAMDKGWQPEAEDIQPAVPEDVLVDLAILILIIAGASLVLRSAGSPVDMTASWHAIGWATPLTAAMRDGAILTTAWVVALFLFALTGYVVSRVRTTQ